MKPFLRHAGLWLAAALCVAHAASAADAVPLSALPAEFGKFIAGLRAAANGRDREKIHASVAADYYIKRDFGGVFDPKATAVQNFSADFQFDNSKLREEFKDHGWKEFGRFVNRRTFAKAKSGEIRTPPGKGKLPESQLCFRKDANGKWVIAGIIHGGD